MGLEQEPILHGRLAYHALYHHARRRASARLRTAPVVPAGWRLQCDLHGPGVVPRPVRGLLPALLAVAGLLLPGYRPQSRDRPQGLAGLAARPRRAAAPPQPGPDRRGAPRAAQAAP